MIFQKQEKVKLIQQKNLQNIIINKGFHLHKKLLQKRVIQTTQTHHPTLSQQRELFAYQKLKLFFIFFPLLATHKNPAFMKKKSKRQSPSESYLNVLDTINNGNNQDSRVYPSFLYQNPSFSISLLQQFETRDVSKPYKKSKKNNQQEEEDKQLSCGRHKTSCDIQKFNQLKKNNNYIQNIECKSQNSSSYVNKKNITATKNNKTITDVSNIATIENSQNNNNNSINITNNINSITNNNNYIHFNYSSLSNQNFINFSNNSHEFIIPQSYADIPNSLNLNYDHINSYIEYPSQNTNKSLHFSFEKSKMIGRTNSSYVYSLHDENNQVLHRALKLQLHPKLKQTNQINQIGQDQNSSIISHNHKCDQFVQKCMCEMLKDEWNVLQKMDHPHILKAFQLYENIEIEPNSFCCAIEMELAECNLHQLLAKVSQHKQFCLSFAKRILLEVTSALNYLHNNSNYTHNDIKADNVFIFCDDTTGQYFTKLADLGTAREYSNENHNSSTLFQNWKIRNPDYQPPEIITFLNEAKNKEQIDNVLGFDEKKADIFNLGTLFFAVLFQLRPFSCRGATQNDPLYKLIFEKRYQEFWSQEKFQRMLNHWATEQNEQDMYLMIQLITNMIQQDPSQRPTIQEVLQNPWFSQDKSLQQKI
ncbi:Serine/Threonine kinase domain protein (macronuclear) [Tetrahymena thermophila SB210]|uniref:Serine/Threonine kinase domain protein n=1 Tax=Tetrahymena thermophila (strain SB210) TaxID=312017 RepID=Q22CN6_TETTS|nr:Serine/Threonine kinase domain protein [Tetrahymena thermophila SB210]EAR83079.2 Serine/Threonine kinase domain protein [Tetrahymena thermophila SB210]|eukprot:XP_001030742.2 Serine/Threonine kinase domain protein [Tetrahymena thermophila SB210]